MQRIKCFLAMLSMLAFCTPFAFADSNKMPKAAPDFRHKSPVTKSASAPIAAIGDGETVFRVQTAPAQPLTGQVDAADNLLKGNIGKIIKTEPGQLTGGAAVQPEQFRAWLEQAHPKFALGTSTMDSANVVEVKGIYDNSGKTLRSLGIQFDRIGGGDLDELPLDKVRVLVVDCPGRVPRETFQKVRDFVSRGGYLLSTDWSSDNLVAGAFPGYIKWDKHTNSQSVYDAEIVKPDPSLFARTVTNASWKMDIDSHMIQTLRPDVRILAISRQLASEDPTGHGALAVVFPFGRGYVMHMVGHFDNNTMMPWRNMLADPAPVIGISLRQALAANFVVAGLSHTKIPI